MTSSRGNPLYQNGDHHLCYRDNPVCPWCGKEDTDAYYSGEMEEKSGLYGCQFCGKVYEYQVDMLPVYTTRIP